MNRSSEKDLGTLPVMQAPVAKKMGTTAAVEEGLNVEKGRGGEDDRWEIQKLEDIYDKKFNLDCCRLKFT